MKKALALATALAMALNLNVSFGIFHAIKAHAAQNLIANGDFESTDENDFPTGWDSDGKNLIPDGSFETGTASWSLANTSAADFTFDSTKKRTGNYSLKIAYKSTQTSQTWAAARSMLTYNNKKIVVNAGEAYRLRAYFNMSGYTSGSYAMLSFQIDDSAGTKKVSEGGVSAARYQQDTASGTDWDKKELDYTIPASVGQGGKLYLIAARTNGMSGMIANVDDVAIEKLGRVDKTTGYNSSSSLKIVGYSGGYLDSSTPPNEDSWYTSSASPVTAGDRLNYSYMLKTSGSGNAFIRFTFKDASNNSIGIIEGDKQSDISDWTNITGSVTVPAEATSMVTSLVVTPGLTAWFDNLSVTKEITSVTPAFNLSDLLGHGGETLTASAEIPNNTGSDMPALLAVALYEKGTNKLVKIGLDQKTISNGSSLYLAASIQLPNPEDKFDMENYFAKCFVWGGADGLKPLADVIKLPSTTAVLNVNKMFGDNMVLQRNAPIPVYGTGTPGTPVTVTLNNEQPVSTIIDDGGNWRADLPSHQAGGPYQLKVDGRNASYTFSNVMIGEVWVCSGQSNMAFLLNNADGGAQEASTANYPNLRLYTIGTNYAQNPVSDPNSSWKVCSPSEAGNFSAVAYYYGKYISQDLGNVPVGLILSSVGGTAIELWMNSEAIDPNRDKYAQNSQLYNGMIAPIIPYGIKGVLWYQGEQNQGMPNNAPLYKDQLQAMINGWRTKWGQQADNGKFPFVLIQLPGYDSDGFAMIRDAQKAVSEIDGFNVGLTVTIDVGDKTNIHPTNKQIVGRRAANVALNKFYGQSTVVYSGPTFRSKSVNNNIMTVAFDNVGSGLKASNGSGIGDTITGFFLAGEDGRYKVANATITGIDTVDVYSAEVANPVDVRYAFEGWTNGNLYSSIGLPAGPFRTDNYNVVYRTNEITPHSPILFNGDFESADTSRNTFTGFVLKSSSGSVETNTSNVHGGAYSAKLYSSTNGSWCGWFASEDNFTVPVYPGQYKITMWAKTQNFAANTYGTLSFSLRDKYGNYVTSPIVDGGSSLQWTETNVYNSGMFKITGLEGDGGTDQDANGFKKYEAIITVPSDGVFINGFCPRLQIKSDGANQTIYFDDVSIERVN